jgi:hypothetical protein
MLKSSFVITSLRILLPDMRMIIFCLSFFFAITQPASAHIQSDLTSHNFTITQHDAFSIQHSSQQNNLSLAISFIDIDEDEITDPARKIIHLAKKGDYNFASTLHTYSEKKWSVFNSSTYYFQLHPSLFLFFGSFRL